MYFLKKISEIIEFIGRKTIDLIEGAGSISLFMMNFFKQLIRRPLYLRLTFRQAEILGVNSLPIVLLTSFFTGAVLALQAYHGFNNKALADATLGSVVALSILRELGPVLAGLMVSGRVGAAIAAELGTMKVSEQIDAMITLATNPIKYLVVPRVLACCLMLPLLVIIADVVGILGGYLISTTMLDINGSSYLQSSFSNVQFDDIFIGLIKALTFGFIIGIIGCYQGMKTSSGAEGVGRSTTTAVVYSSVLIFVADYFVTAFLF
ncbi:MAG: ABC transporter permease [Proteobacteria bacterium]|nr:ABC transporter permease [Pseudomonadota bacterium]